MLDKVQEDRLKKLSAIREMGIDPYGRRYDTAKPAAAVRAEYEKWEQQAGGHEAAKAKPDKPRGDAAGRIILMRDMGKMMFLTIRDESGTIQLAFRKRKEGADAAASVATLCDADWKLAGLLDLGDIIAAQGPLERTRTGEITIWCEKLTLLAKSLNPMPEKWHGLSDTEIRYRQRYLDLMTNPDSMEIFKKRIAIIDHFRTVLAGKGFVEVETPMMQSIYGGAAARPFTTHHNALDIDLFMRISPELYLKRLLVGGMEKVYEINRNFRNEGIDTRHNPEFTMMELYQAYADYEVMMDITEELISGAAENISGGTSLPYGQMEINFTRPWPRLKYADLLKEHAGVEMRDSAAVRAKARQLGIEEANKDDAVVINEVFEATVEPQLAKSDRPTFVIDYPAEICPLTRRKADDPSIALRFECFIAGMEIANAYTELNDPAVQEENFRRQLRGEAANETMRVMDEDFITALRHGMPPAGGLGIGIDRVVMLLTNKQSIRDVVLFPLLRPVEQK